MGLVQAQLSAPQWHFPVMVMGSLDMVFFYVWVWGKVLKGFSPFNELILNAIG
jgi:hypothetical protein